MLKIIFTHPQYGILGTVAASRLGSVQVPLSSPISAGKYKTFPKRLRKCEDFPQTKRAHFLFFSIPLCFVLIHFPVLIPVLPSWKNIVPSRKSWSIYRRGRPRSPRRRTSCRVSTAEPSSPAASSRACAESSRGTTRTSRWVGALSQYPAVAGEEDVDTFPFPSSAKSKTILHLHMQYIIIYTL